MFSVFLGEVGQEEPEVSQDQFQRDDASYCDQKTFPNATERTTGHRTRNLSKDNVEL